MAERRRDARAARPSLRTIAEAVNLSQSAVSLALRGDRSIPPETRRRVLAAADEVNYEYVPRTRRAKKHQLRRLAFTIHNYGNESAIANPFYGYILSSVGQICQEQHLSLSFVVVQHEHLATDPLPSVLTHDIDGVLLTSPYPPPLIERIHRESGGPVVLLDNIVPGSPYDSVMADDFGGAYQATRHLLELGHQQIAMLTDCAKRPGMVFSFQERYRGYREACSDVGLTPLSPAAVSIDGILPPAVGSEKFSKWVETYLEQFPHVTAFFCAADLYAAALLPALAGMGMQVPEDISVVGFDDLTIANSCQPALTTVHSFRNVMSRLAVDRLIARIDGDDSPGQYLNLQTQLVVRKSSGPRPATTGS